MFTDALKCEREIQTKVFYFAQYPHIFQYVAYSPIIGVLCKVMSYIVLISWGCREVFITNISLAFTEAFRQINRELLVSIGQPMLPTFYWKYRTFYSTLRSVVTEFDGAINAITMLALAKNIFTICAHLFKSL